MAKQMRVHILAKELGVTSKAILEKCRAEGLDLKNHMSTLSAGLEATVREWFSEGVHKTVEEKAERVDLQRVRKKATRKRTIKKKAEPPAETEKTATAVAEAEAPPAKRVKKKKTTKKKAASAKAQPKAVPETEAEGAPDTAVAVVAEAPPEAEAPVEPAAAEAGSAVAAPAEAAPAPPAGPPGDQEVVEPTEPPMVRPAAEVPAAEAGEQPPEGPEAEPEEEQIAPAGPQLTEPAPAQLQGPQVIRVDAPEPERRYPRRAGPRPTGPRPGGPRAAGGPRQEGPRGRGGPPGSRGMVTEPRPVSDRPPGGKRARGKDVRGAPDDTAPGKGGGKHRVHPRRSSESLEAEERIREYRDRDLIEREERLKAAGERGGLRRRAAETSARGPGVTAPKVGRAELTEPIVLKDFCAATGIGFNRVFPKLMGMGRMARITDTIDQDTAKLIGAEFEIEVTIKQARSLLDVLKEEFDSIEQKELAPRPPVVALLGHVDHGKTSLLDAIRKSRVIDREAGGITQQIGAYRFCEGGVDVSFIDTPGHEAFTAMRSRGATVTDVVVLVVAADDGVMQTTREAIQHARAADVPMVVALNKIDLPGVDVNRIYGQLAEENLTPAEWGGETDVIKTSAINGEGIQELLEHLTTLTELLELRADPTVDARGWVVEAEEKKGEGIVATLLVTDGTLTPGTTILCGPAHGRVRAMRDDLGKRVKAATPGTPVEVSGLDVVPVAGERFYQVSDPKRAKQIAQERQDRIREELLAEVSKPSTLEELFQEREADEVPELTVILRADTRGKLETLRAELSNLSADEVRLRILLDGIGAISESDVALASTSRAIIIGFWVVAEETARRMAQDLGVDVRLYRVIYEVTDDIRRALEGLLEPERQEVYQGRLEVRQVFNIGRVGTVAGCYMADGVVARNHRVRLIRDGAIVREDCPIASLRRVKDDVREVRAGLECGLKIEDFNDVHVGDVIEAYEVIEVARALS